MINRSKTLEKVFLVLVILLQIGDFFEVLPEDIDFIKKIISWLVLGYLFVKISISKILMGTPHKEFDKAIVLTYFLFSIKNLTAVAIVGHEEVAMFHGLFNVIVNNTILIEKYAFTLAGYLLIFLAAYMALHLPIRKKSLMGILHEQGQPKKEAKILLRRFLAIFLMLIAFFIFIFNLAFEWLAIAVDAPLAMVGILLYFFIIIRYHKKFNTTTFMYKIGNMGESFYEKFIHLLTDKKRVYLCVMGLLALHLLTDIGNFILPYIINLKDHLYFKRLGPGHTPFLTLLMNDIQSLTLLESLSVSAIYVFNTIGILFLLFLPTWMWYRLWIGKKLHVKRRMHAVIATGLATLLMFPMLSIQRIALPALVGVDIQTHSILAAPSWFFNVISQGLFPPLIGILLALLVGVVVYILEKKKRIKKDVFLFAIIVGMLFFGYYVLLFFLDIGIYYLSIIQLLAMTKNYFIAFYFLTFSIMNVALYVGGYALFIYELVNHHLYEE
jgi:hypothetical protein